jgi:transposase
VNSIAANLSWPLPDSLDDTQLERLLFPPSPGNTESQERQTGKAQPDFVKIHEELTANRSVTLQLLWEEFIEEHPEGAHYSCSASSIAIGPAIWTWCCGRNTAPARRPSSIMPATRLP